MSAVEFVAHGGPDAADGAARTPPQAAPVAEDATAQPRMRRRLPRLGRRSLTSRIVTGVVALVVVLVLGIGGGTYYALRAFLLHRLDQQLNSVALQNAVYFDSCLRNDPIVTPNGLACRVRGPANSQREWVTIIDRGGESFVVSGGSLISLELTSGERADIAASPRDIRTLTVTEGELRVTARQTQDGLVVVTGMATAEAGRVLNRLFALEIIIGGSAIALALFATYGGVRFSLRGLRRVTTTAQEVAAELSPSGAALQRRVPVTEEGTEVAQLIDSMNTLLHATETQFAARVESEERMRRFLADASHELRTPLTSIRGYAELTRMQRAIGAPGEDNIDRIEAEGTRMSRLVEDLLLLARGDAAEFEPQRVPIDVDELVYEAVSSARAAYPERAIDIDAMLPTQVHGDPDQVLRVVRNLITNAVVHTRPDSPIRVGAFADGAGGVAVQVVDGGPGLPPEAAAHVFERFWRADKARTRARGGSGLGLSIVAAIVRAHRGTVRFDSSVEAGTTVTVWLPSGG